MTTWLGDDDSLRPSTDAMLRAGEMIRAAWPELHVDVKWNPIGQKVGILGEHEVGSKAQRNQAGTMLGAWRKLLSEPPVWFDSDEWYRAGGRLNECQVLLLVGTAAIRGWREDLLPAELWGRWGIAEGKWMVMPVQDPTTLARGSAGKWGEQVTLFFEGAVSGVGTWGLSGECVRGTCAKRLWKYDKDGVAWCEQHWTERYPSVKVKKAKAVRTDKVGERMVL